jgi:hypothetical protein
MATLTDQPEAEETDTLRDRLYGELADLLAQGGGPEAILAFRSSDTVQERAYDLIYKQRDGALTPEEERELNAFVEREHILRLAKVRARLLLQNRPADTPPSP